MHIHLILTYIGTPNNYWEHYLNSALLNNDILTLYVFSDIDIPESYIEKYKNVKFIPITFDEIKNRLCSFLKKNLNLDFHINDFANIKVHKLCDIKVIFRYLFSEYITFSSDEDYVGWCDCDLIFGKISYFSEKYNFNNYDLLGNWGHFTVIKHNHIFWDELLKQKETFYHIFKNHEHLGFDEYSKNNVRELWNKLYHEKKMKLFLFSWDQIFSDVVRQDESEDMYVWTEKNARVYFEYIVNDGLYKVYRDRNIKVPTIYSHFQKRKFSNIIKKKHYNKIIFDNSKIEEF
tara:strand:+ start:255 stop:1124 length:870 start_codon:yes stop_codon:yes gene_type:complete